MDVRLEADARVVRRADAPDGAVRYVRAVNWLERQLARLRSFNPLAVDVVLAVVFTLVGIATAFGQDISDDEGFREPSALLVVSALVICAPIAIRRRWPLIALTISAIGVLVHLLVGWPEGSLPLATLLLTFTVGAWCPLRRAVAGLAMLCVTILVLALGDAPTLDTVGAFGVLANFAAVWALGVAFRNRRAVSDARVREADERAEAERQRAARVLAEERLRIAQELHDVVAHSMSVIAVQAGVGEHVIDEQPEQARAALEAISATSRGRSPRCAGCSECCATATATGRPPPRPVSSTCRGSSTRCAPPACPRRCTSKGRADCVHAGIELSAYRVVQEALTNVIKHAGTPTRVDVTVRHLTGLAGRRGRRRRARAGGAAGQRRCRQRSGGRLRAGPCRHARAGRAVGRRALGRAGARRWLPGQGAAAVR